MHLVWRVNILILIYPTSTLKEMREASLFISDKKCYWDHLLELFILD